MFHQNLSQANFPTATKKIMLDSPPGHRTTDSATMITIDHKSECHDTPVSDERFSPLSTGHLQQLTNFESARSYEDDIDMIDAFMCPSIELSTTSPNRMPSPLPPQRRLISIDQKLQELDLRTHTSAKVLPNVERYKEAAHGGDEFCFPSLTPDAVSAEPESYATDDALEDETQSILSLENAQLLEAHAQTLTRLTVAPLQPHGEPLHSIATISQQSTPVTEASSTLIDFTGSFRPSPVSLDGHPFSLYASSSETSRQPTESPCNRLPPEYLTAASTRNSPTRSSRLHEVKKLPSTTARRLDLENFDPTRFAPLADPSTSAVNRDSIDLSSPLSVPLEDFSSPDTTPDCRLRGSRLLVATNTFLAHATSTKRERLAREMLNVFAAHGICLRFVNSESLSSDLLSSPVSEKSSSTAVSGPDVLEPDIGAPEALFPLHKTRVLSGEDANEVEPVSDASNHDWETYSTSSQLDPMEDQPLLSPLTTRTEILDLLANNNTALREMVTSWTDHLMELDTRFPAPFIRSPQPYLSTPLQVRKRQAVPFHKDNMTRSQHLSPSPARNSIDAKGNRRFSDHTFASLNRSLQTLKLDASPSTPVNLPKTRMPTTATETPKKIAPSPISGKRHSGVGDGGNTTLGTPGDTVGKSGVLSERRGRRNARLTPVSAKIKAVTVVDDTRVGPLKQFRRRWGISVPSNGSTLMFGRVRGPVGE